MEEKGLTLRVFKIISQVMNVSPESINENSSPEHIEQWDSLQHMNLLLALEDDFKIKFTEEEIATMMDTKSILKTIQNKK